MKARLFAAATVACFALGCSDNGSEMAEPTGDGDGDDGSLCAKYGGAANIATVVQTNVIGEIAADCRINTFFTSLSENEFTRVNDCLTIQVQELFGCSGITYEGSKDSNGKVCRSMVDAHRGLLISDGDFMALIEDVVAGLQDAGVAQADIDAAAPALLGMQADIVEKDGVDDPTKLMCAAGGSGGM